MLSRSIRTIPLLLLVGSAPVAFAHAILVHSSPTDQAVVHSRNAMLALDYNSRIDARRSTLTLTGPGGITIPIEMHPVAKPSELAAAAENLKNGNYQLHWQVLASDGHITRGEIAFTVNAK